MIGTNDQEDSKLGIVPNNKLDIPIILQATQYLGEEIVEYVEPPVEEPEGENPEPEEDEPQEIPNEEP